MRLPSTYNEPRKDEVRDHVDGSYLRYGRKSSTKFQGKIASSGTYLYHGFVHIPGQASDHDFAVTTSTWPSWGLMSSRFARLCGLLDTVCGCRCSGLCCAVRATTTSGRSASGSREDLIKSLVELSRHIDGCFKTDCVLCGEGECVSVAAESYGRVESSWQERDRRAGSIDVQGTTTTKLGLPRCFVRLRSQF